MFYRIIFASTLSLLLAGCSADQPLEVRDAWVREVVPGQDKTAGYFIARNHSGEPIVLIGASSERARAIELHTTSRDGDIMRMRRLQEVVIAAGDTVRFEPGARHLMLFGVAELEEPVEIVLESADGRQFPVSFDIEPFGAEQ